MKKLIHKTDMIKRARTVLVLVCSLLFFLVAPAVFLCSQGYRLDLQEKKLTQTGAFYFDVSPKKVDIYLNGKLKKRTDWLFGSALIENVLPKKYSVEIKKQGFHSWKKDLEIRGKWVTEAKNIVLIPQDLSFKTLAEETDAIFFAPNAKKAVFKKSYSQEDKKGWVLKIFDPREETEGPLIKDNDLSLKTIEFIDLKWSFDSKEILLETKIAQKTKYFIFSVQNNQAPVLTPLDFIGQGVENIFFNPQNSQKIFFVKKEINQESSKAQQESFSFYEADLSEKKVSLPFLKNILVYKINSKNIFWMSKEGFLFKSNFSANNQEQINAKALPIKEGAKYQIEKIYPEIFLKEDEKLFIFSKENEEFKQVLDSVKDIDVSSDLKKIVAWDDSEIRVLFLETQYGQPPKKAGEVMFLFRFSKKIDKVLWLTDHYLIFNTGNKIKIAEIDNRDQINVVDLGEFENPEIFLNKNLKLLYILSENRLLVSKELAL